MVAPLLNPSAFGDLQNVTRAEQAVGRLTDIASNYRDCIFMSMMLKPGKIKKSKMAGKSFQWTCFVNGSGSFAVVPMVYQDQLTNVDTTAIASADWRHWKVDWPEVAQVTAMNSGNDVQIISARMLQEKAADLAKIEGLEQQWWGSPVSSTDTISLWGVNTWLPKVPDVSYTADGLVGTVPSGYTSVGLNPTTYPNWKHYYFKYNNITDEDFIRRLCKAINDTNFVTFVNGLPTFTDNIKRAFFTNYATLASLQEYLKASNENLGFDVTYYLGKPVVNGIPIINVPYLDRDTSNTFYGINIEDFELAYLDGFWDKKTVIKNMPGFHNVTGTFLDTTGQIICRNRRRSFLGSTTGTYAF